MLSTMQAALERAQSQYMTQGQKEADDIIEAATQAEQFPSPYGHRQMRMASQMATASQGQPLPNIVCAVNNIVSPSVTDWTSQL